MDTNPPERGEESTAPRGSGRGRRLAVLVFLIAAALAAIFAVYAFFDRSQVMVRIEGERVMEITADIADGALSRYVGLMFREDLPRGRGMLFRYRVAAPRSFWMKYTRIPLDIIFIGENLRVLNVVEAEPCRSDRCPRYRSVGPAAYVLEVNRGSCRGAGIGEGAEVTFHEPATP